MEIGQDVKIRFDVCGIRKNTRLNRSLTFVRANKEPDFIEVGKYGSAFCEGQVTYSLAVACKKEVDEHFFVFGVITRLGKLCAIELHPDHNGVKATIFADIENLEPA